MASKTTRVFLDRFEGDLGVLVSPDGGRDTLDIPRAFLPDGVREGTALTLTLSEDVQATEAGKAEVASLMEQLLNRNT
jgi:hypothetical protein